MTTPRYASTNIWIESDGQRWGHAYVRRLSGVEAIGQLFSYDLDVVCDAEGDVPEGVRAGGDRGASTPSANASEALLVVEVRHEAEVAVFPRRHDPLTWSARRDVDLPFGA